MIDDDVFGFVHVLKGVWGKKDQYEGSEKDPRTWRVGEGFEGK